MTFVERMIGAARLDARTYEEIEADQSALPQAMTVVALASLAAGVGALGEGTGFMAIIWGIVLAFVGWLVWALVTWLVGTKLLPEPQTNADLGQMLRVLGFAFVPNLILVLAIIPFIGWIFKIIAWLWLIAAFVVAVRQGLDYTSTGRAIGVVLIGFVCYLLINCVLLSVLGVGTMGAGAIRSMF